MEPTLRLYGYRVSIALPEIQSIYLESEAALERVLRALRVLEAMESSHSRLLSSEDIRAAVGRLNSYRKSGELSLSLDDQAFVPFLVGEPGF